MTEQIYKVRDPSGAIRELKGPPGATDEQVIAKAKELISGPWEKYAAPSGPWDKYKPSGPKDYKAMSKPVAVDPTEGMSFAEKGLAGIGKGMTDPVRGVGQLMGLVSREDIDRVKEQDAALMNTGAGFAGNIVGNMAALAPTALIPGAGTYAGAAAIGAGQGLAAPVGTDDSRLTNAGLGATGGAVGTAVTRGLARVAQPIQQTEPVKQLLKEGVVPTPGQAAGGLALRIENSVESIPFIGQIIKNAKARGAEELNAAALKRSVPPHLADQVTAIGRKGLEQADDLISQGYERVVPNISIPGGNDFRRRLVDAATGGERFLTEQSEKELQRVLQSRVFDRLPNSGPIPGRLVQRMDSELGTIARDYARSSDASQRAFAGAVRDVQRELRSNIEAFASGPASAELKELNKAFANLVRVEKASGYVGAKDGVFSAAQLQSAVRASDPSRNKNAFAKGNALMQDLSDPAKQVMGDVVPDSGTAGRLLTAAGVGLAGVDSFFGSPGFLTALAASPPAYSRLGSRYILGDLPHQGRFSEAIRRASPIAAQFGRSVLLGQ